MPDFSDISLLPPGYGAATPAGGGGLLGGLFGGGQQPNYGGLIGAAGGGDLDTDKLMNMLIRRQLEQSMQPNWGAFTAALGKAAQPSLLPKSLGAALAEASGALSSNEGGDLKGLQALKLASDIKNAQQLAKLRSMTPGQMADFMKELAAWNRGGQSGPPPLPGVGPAPAAAPNALPRLTGNDESTGDLSPTTGEVPTGDAGGIDADLKASAKTLASYATGNAVPGGLSSVEGVSSEMANRVMQMASAMPPEIAAKFQIISGFRSPERQAQVNPGVTNSRHSHGMALDLGNDPDVLAWINANGPRYGLGFPLSRDPRERNHLEMVDAGGRVPIGAYNAPRVTQAAYTPGSAAKERFLSLAEQLESGGRNVPNYKYGPGYTAGGNFQIDDPTWRDFAPPEVKAQYARAMDAPYGVQRAVAQRIPVNRWTDNNPRLAAAAQNADGLLQTLAAIDPRQSPTAAVAGGLPPQDEVIRTGPPPAIPGLLRAQYTGQVNPDQSPSIQMGGQPMPAPAPAAPAARPPMAPSTPPSYVPQNIPQPDTAATEALLARLAAMRALTEAQGLGDPFKPLSDMILNSPRYLREKIQTEAGAKLPYQYLEPSANVALQGELAWVRAQSEQLAKYLGPEANVALQRQLAEAQAQGKAGVEAISAGWNEWLKGQTGTPVTVTMKGPDGKPTEYKLTPNQFVQMQTGQAGPFTPPPGMFGGPAAPAGGAAPSQAPGGLTPGGGGFTPGQQLGTPTGDAAAAQKARLELDTLDAKTLREQATAGRKILPLLGEVTRLAYEAPGGLSGRASAELARLLPFPVPASWTNAEVLGSLGQQFLPSVRAPGAQSNAEMTAGLQAVPGLMQSQEGRTKIAAINKAMIERTIEMADIYREHLGTPELHRKLAELDKKPLFSDDIRREIGFGGQGNQPGGTTSTGVPWSVK